MARKVKGGILIGLVTGTVVAVVVEAIWNIGPKFSDDGVNPGGWGLSVPELPTSLVSIPDLSLIGQVSFGSFERIGWLAALMLVFTLVFTNFFDAMGTMTGLSKEAGLADEKGDFPRIKSALIVEGVGAVAGGYASASSNTVFIESGAGIGEGARTGFANVVTGLLFLVAMFFTPLVSIVPSEVAAAALVIVGALMMSQIKYIDFSEFSVLLPVFLAITVMPLTYSIANGIGAGFIAWVVVRSLSGKAKEISPLLWIVAAGFFIYFARGPVEAHARLMPLMTTGCCGRGIPSSHSIDRLEQEDRDEPLGPGLVRRVVGPDLERALPPFGALVALELAREVVALHGAVLQLDVGVLPHVPVPRRRLGMPALGRDREVAAVVLDAHQRGLAERAGLGARRDVRTMIGLPRRRFASAPSDASNFSACLRAQSDVDGLYSPVSGMVSA